MSDNFHLSLSSQCWHVLVDFFILFEIFQVFDIMNDSGCILDICCFFFLQIFSHYYSVYIVESMLSLPPELICYRPNNTRHYHFQCQFTRKECDWPSFNHVPIFALFKHDCWGVTFQPCEGMGSSWRKKYHGEQRSCDKICLL